MVFSRRVKPRPTFAFDCQPLWGGLPPAKLNTTRKTLGRGGCPQVFEALREGDPTARFESPTRAVRDNGPYLTPTLCRAPLRRGRISSSVGHLRCKWQPDGLPPAKHSPEISSHSGRGGARPYRTSNLTDSSLCRAPLRRGRISSSVGHLRCKWQLGGLNPPLKALF